MAKKSFPLRIDEQVFELLREWADDEFRSVNGQVEYLLREALREAGRLPKPIPNAGVEQSFPDDRSEGIDRSE